MKIRIIGTGSWASALCQVLVDNQVDVLMIGVDPLEVSDINNNHRNSKYFDVELSKGVKASLDFKDCQDADVILLATPSKVIVDVLNKVKNYLQKKVIVINVSKGFDVESNQRLSTIIRQVMKEQIKDVVSLIGPSHAEEVIVRLLTSVNAVSNNIEYAKQIQELFSNSYFRVYRNDDEIGAEIGSALKNIMALASGILEGLNQGDNAKAAMMTRGLAEITRFGTYFNARQETFLGLNGVGDLIVTCLSHHSRNFQAGLAIGKADSAQEFLKTNKKTVEGINACLITKQIADKHGLVMPITNAVYDVLFNNKKPSSALKELMNRELKQEFDNLK